MTGKTHVSVPVFGAGTDIVEVGATGVARITARERFTAGGSHAWALRFRSLEHHAQNEPKEDRANENPI